MVTDLTYFVQACRLQRDDQSPHDGTILFRTSDAITHEKTSKPSQHLEKVQKVLMGQQRARNKRDMCTPPVHIRHMCNARVHKRHTGKALGSTDRIIGNVCATDTG